MQTEQAWSCNGWHNPIDYVDDAAPLMDTRPVEEMKPKAKAKSRIKQIIKELVDSLKLVWACRILKNLLSLKNKLNLLKLVGLVGLVQDVEPVEHVNMTVKYQYQCPNCNNVLHAQTWSYSHKHICTRKDNTEPSRIKLEANISGLL